MTTPHDLKPYPTDDAVDRPPARRTGRGVFTRYVLPVLLFVAVVGAVAWITQYMPSRGTTVVKAPIANANDAGAGGTNRPAGASPLEFARSKAVWDANDPTYVREYEKGVKGQYDFPFRNVSDTAVDLGLMSKSCDCTEVQVALLSAPDWQTADETLSKDPAAEPKFAHPPSWQPLAPSETAGVRLEPKQGGLLRITWNGRRSAGERLNLRQRIWGQSVGSANDRRIDLEVPVVMAQPVNFLPDKINVGILGQNEIGRGEFQLWSATRDQLDLLTVQEKTPDALVEVRTRAMTPNERTALQEQLRKKEMATRVRATAMVEVVVHEQKDGKEMDQGPFFRRLTVSVDDVPLDTSPLITGSIKGDVEVGAYEDRGRVQFGSFATSDGARKVIALSTDAKVLLETASQEPPFLEVKLIRKESASQRNHWQLQVTVPPNAAYGPLPETSAVYVRTVGAVRRVIRIPVLGTGASNQ